MPKSGNVAVDRHRCEEEAGRESQRATRAAFVKAYRLKMNALIRSLLDLEEAMISKDWAKANVAASAMSDTQKAGHKRFKPKRRTRKR